MPKGLTKYLTMLHQELSSHMMKEEQILFPMIKQGMGGKQPARAQQHKPQRGDHQRFTGIVFQGQQHQHKDEEGHAHPAHDFT